MFFFFLGNQLWKGRFLCPAFPSCDEAHHSRARAATQINKHRLISPAPCPSCRSSRGSAPEYTRRRRRKPCSPRCCCVSRAGSSRRGPVSGYRARLARQEEETPLRLRRRLPCRSGKGPRRRCPLLLLLLRRRRLLSRAWTTRRRAGAASSAAAGRRAPSSCPRRGTRCRAGGRARSGSRSRTCRGPVVWKRGGIVFCLEGVGESGGSMSRRRLLSNLLLLSPLLSSNLHCSSSIFLHLPHHVDDPLLSSLGGVDIEI